MVKLKILLLLITAFKINQINGQTINEINKLVSCQNKWEYLDLKKQLVGTILSFHQPIVECGVMSSASNAIIKLSNGDTIRILTLCNTKEIDSLEKFKVGEIVQIIPETKPSFQVGIIPYDKWSCSINRVYFGELRLNN